MDMDNCELPKEQSPSISHSEEVENPIANSSIMTEKAAETVDSPKTAEKKLARKDSGLKSITPIHCLQLPNPKASNFSDRCMSPTDLLISPVSKRLLYRNRKGSGLGKTTSFQEDLFPNNVSKEAASIGI